MKSRLFSVPVLMSPPCSRPARGRVHVTVQQRRGVAGVTLSLKQWAMTYRQVRGRAASLSPKSRPKIPLPAQSALCLPRNPLPAARTVRKSHRFLNGGRVPYDGQAGAAIGCSVSASVFSHGTPSLRPSGCLALLSTVPTPSLPNSVSLLHCTDRSELLSLSGFKLGDDLKMVAKTVTVWPVSLDGCSLGGAAKATSAGVETSVGQEKMGRR